MKANLKSWPIVTEDCITWSKIDLDDLTETVLTISMEAAKEAVNNLIKSLLYESEEEFLNSDDFINSPDNQIKVINHVLSKYIGWK